MPELPEVETIKNGLEKKVLGKPILKVEIKNTKVIRNSKKDFVADLENGVFLSIERRGKMLIFSIENNSKKQEKFLLVRLCIVTGKQIGRAHV